MSQAKAHSAQEIIVTLPDGKIRNYAAGTTGMDIAVSIAPSLAKASLAIELNGVLSDLSLPIFENVSIRLIKREDPEALNLIRHDCAHVLAEAVQNLFPGTQVTIGPNIENGFFYDFYRDKPFTTDDFPAIEKKMAEIIARGDNFVREVWSRDEAIAHFKKQGEDFKVELIQDLPVSEDIKIYKQGVWLDLCRGPHMPATKNVGTAFKLMKVAGAYWRGDSKRPMLTRIYGTAWRDQKELDAYITQIEEAEKRDHRKIGREMDLFHFQEEAQGSVFWHPKGYAVYNQLESYIRRRLRDSGYVEVKTPQLIDNKLWEASGHWGKYRENMFVVPDVVPNIEEGSDPFKGLKLERLMALKPMNCPAHVQIFRQGIKSYRDLPLRMAEFGVCHRNEAHGALHGLMRVRQMTQDDAHIFCREDQIESESVAFCNLLTAVYQDMGFSDVTVRLATRPVNRAGSDTVWDKAETGLEAALKKTGIAYEIAAGDGAFYGPKLEFHLKDAIGRSWQLGTLQLDFVLPERLDANYIGEDGQKYRPVMLHRAIFGSLERFIGVMLENYAGRLPLWLAPVQIAVATVTSEANDYAHDVYKQLTMMGLRAELDIRNEKINYKVRDHSLAKVPALFVVGAKEAEAKTVAVRRLGSDKNEVFTLSEALKSLADACKAPY